MKKGVTAGFILIAALIGFLFGYTLPHKTPLSAEGTKSHEWHATNNVVAYVLPAEGPYYDLKWMAASSELRKLGYEPQKYTAGAYKNIKTQADIIDNLVQRKVAAIILHSVSDSALIPAVGRAWDAGIPVVAENVDIPSDKIAGRVMLANYENGWELAMALAREIRGQGKIAALVGPAGLETTDEMWRGAKAYLAKFPKIQIVREEYLGPNTPEALERAEAILAAHPDLAGFYTWFVQNGVGAAEAVRKSGVQPNTIKIVAKDTNPQGEELMREGYMHSLLVGSPIDMGRNSARMVDALLKNQPGERSIVMRNELMDKDTIDVIDRSGFDPVAAKLDKGN